MKKIVKKFLSTVLVLSLLSGFSVSIASFATEFAQFRGHLLFEELGGNPNAEPIEIFEVEDLIIKVAEGHNRIVGIAWNNSPVSHEYSLYDTTTRILQIPAKFYIKNEFNGKEEEITIKSIDSSCINNLKLFFKDIHIVYISSEVQIIGDCDKRDIEDIKFVWY